MLSVRRLNKSSGFSDCHQCSCSCYFWNGAPYFTNKNHYLWILFTSLQESNAEVIPVSKAHVYLARYKTFCTDRAVSIWVVNALHTWAFHLNFASRQCCAVCTSQFPFLNTMQETVTPSEVCPYGHINLNLVHVQQQSLVSKSLGSMHAGKARNLFWFKTILHHILVVYLWPRTLILTLILWVIRIAGNHLAMGCSSVDSKNKGGHGMVFLISCSLLYHHHHHHLHQLRRLVLFHNFWINGKS